MKTIEITPIIMKMGFNRSKAGSLSSAVYMSLKHKDSSFILIACKMTKDTRNNGNLWGNESGLDADLIEKFNI